MFMVAGIPLSLSFVQDLSGLEAELEESREQAEYDAFFNSDQEEISAYTADLSDPIVEQLVITNKMLGIIIAVLVFFMIWGLFRFFFHLLCDHIFQSIS